LTSAESAFLASLGAGKFDVIALEPADYTRTARPVEQYADRPLGADDAAVITVAERLGAAKSPPWAGATSSSSAQPTSTH
jgi:predicted nucleic acid-binding protein